MTLILIPCHHTVPHVAKIKPFLSLKKFKIVMHVFVTSRLDYSNSLYHLCPPDIHLTFTVVKWLLLRGELNANTLILISVHWLPVKYRIDFKVLLFVLNIFRIRDHSTYLTAPIHTIEITLIW